MDLYRVVGSVIVGSVAVVGEALRRLSSAEAADWPAQFSEASNDDRRGRRRVEALFRGATVRL